MPTELQIRIEEEGTGIAVIIYGPGTPAGGHRISQKRPEFTEEIKQLLKAFPYGRLTREEIIQLRTAIREWLFSNGVGSVIDGKISQSKRSTRIIYYLTPQLYDQLSYVPLELLTLGPDRGPLCLDERVSSVVHLLDKSVIGNSPEILDVQYLRVLAIRSNPIELGQVIPSTQDLRKAILNDEEDTITKRISLDILSSDAAGIAMHSPTSDNLSDVLQKAGDAHTPYHILVYLGHGSINIATSEPELQFEQEGGERTEPLTAEQFAQIVSGCLIPVVLLVGCFTATEPKVLPQHSRDPMHKELLHGVQGIAQRLVNGVVEVRVAVGMRCQLDSDDALKFLRIFFRNLILRDKGHVEHAVREGRERLHSANHKMAQAWTAPMVFRVKGDEPLFSFLSLPTTLASQTDVRGGTDKSPAPIDLKELVERISDMVDEMVGNITRTWDPNGISEQYVNRYQEEIERVNNAFTAMVRYFEEAPSITNDDWVRASIFVEDLHQSLDGMLFHIEDLSQTEIDDLRDRGRLIELELQASLERAGRLQKLCNSQIWDQVKGRPTLLYRWRSEIVREVQGLSSKLPSLLGLTRETLDFGRSLLR